MVNGECWIERVTTIHVRTYVYDIIQSHVCYVKRLAGSERARGNTLKVKKPAELSSAQ